MNSHILIVEDEKLLARNMREYLIIGGYTVNCAGTVAEGMSFYEKNRPDVVLIDYNLPDGVGLDLVRKIRENDDLTALVIITAYAKVQNAVEAIRAGAQDYLVKPLGLDEIGLLIEKLTAQRRAKISLDYFKRREERRGTLDQIIGNSPLIVEMKQRLRLLLEAETVTSDHDRLPCVLILGETGTGKDMVARALHFESSRRDNPFVEINCASLQDTSAEIELFGIERGGFGHGQAPQPGLIQAADRGTLFLNEIGALSLPIQAKLLQTLEKRTIRPLGGVRERVVDVRVVAATNANLKEKVSAGEFREDLYYRLTTIVLQSPPLRARGDDIVTLAEFFIAALGKQYGRQKLSLADEARMALLEHTWPGNVRELRNALEQACLLTAGTTITAADISLRTPAPIRLTEPSLTSAATSENPERDVILQAIQATKGNLTLAARWLAISRDTLRFRMEKHAIPSTNEL